MKKVGRYRFIEDVMLLRQIFEIGEEIFISETHKQTYVGTGTDIKVAHTEVRTVFKNKEHLGRISEKDFQTALEKYIIKI